jgi:hypothetical protein
MLFSSFEDKTTVNLCRDAHHELAGVGAFRQRPGARVGSGLGIAVISTALKRELQVTERELQRAVNDI